MIIAIVLTLIGLSFIGVYFISNKSEPEEKVTCSKCAYLYYQSDGSVICGRKIDNTTLESFNKRNIRPCKVIKISERIIKNGNEKSKL